MESIYPPLPSAGCLGPPAQESTVATHLCHTPLAVREQQARFGGHAGAAVPQLQLHQEARAGFQDLWRQQHPGLRWQVSNRPVAGMAVFVADTRGAQGAAPHMLSLQAGASRPIHTARAQVITRMQNAPAERAAPRLRTPHEALWW